VLLRTCSMNFFLSSWAALATDMAGNASAAMLSEAVFTYGAESSRVISADPQTGHAMSPAFACKVKSSAEPNQPSNGCLLSHVKSKTIIGFPLHQPLMRCHAV